jgi:hypothetical protein
MTSVANINRLCAPAFLLRSSTVRIIGKIRQTDDHPSLMHPLLPVANGSTWTPPLCQAFSS